MGLNVKYQNLTPGENRSGSVPEEGEKGPCNVKNIIIILYFIIITKLN